MVDQDIESGAPSGEPSDPRSASRWRSIPFIIAAVAVVAVLIVGFLFVQSNSDKADAEAMLTDTQDQLTDTEDQLTDTEDQLTDTEDQLTDTQDQLNDTQDQLNEATANLADADADLADMSRQLDEADDLRQGLIDFLAVSISVGTGLEQSEATCMAESMAAENDMGELLVAFGVVGSLEGTQEDAFSLGLKMFDAASECGISLEGLTGGPQPGFSYGDNAVLDALQDQCAAGAGISCDQLYFSSAVGSEYETFGRTCGNRFSVESAPNSCIGQT